MVTVAQACDFQNTDGIQASLRGFFLSTQKRKSKFRCVMEA